MAAAGYWPETGRLEAFAALPNLPGLRELGLRERVGDLYMRMSLRGELVTLGTRIVGLNEFLQVALRRFGRPAMVAVDMWRADVFIDGLAASGIPPGHLNLRGTDSTEGAGDLKAFQDACENHKVRPLRSLLLQTAISEAKVATDFEGNENLSTENGKAGGLIGMDVALATVLAVAAGSEGVPETAQRFYFGPI